MYRDPERRKYKEDVIEKCRSDLRHINGKQKVKEEVRVLKFDGRKYEGLELMAEIMNRCFQAVLTRGSDFVQVVKEAEMVKIDNVVVTLEHVNIM